MIGIIISFVLETVIIYCGVYFERHIYIEIGNCGISVPAAKENMIKWMYAQAIGPEILIRNGKNALILTVLFYIVVSFFNLSYNNALFISLVINFISIVGSLIAINGEVNQFSPEWLSNDDGKKQNDWIKIATEYARNKQYKALYEFAKSTK